ncbi:hypothetical protein BpHYR1_039427 [Brachionus plicatilis]|uniref:Uncharacterized protein n=1 Tax=Brachionus plicatilis TaxID=10195 RepID=A0A3M7Q6F6_BRAPC|nr:hypothetical protein BpHYR1_039427 [Brachionus plicatilis]
MFVNWIKLFFLHLEVDARFKISFQFKEYIRQKFLENMILVSISCLVVLVSVQADSKRAKNFKNRDRDRDRINRPNFGGRTLARLFWRANF